MPGATYSYGYDATSGCPQDNAGEDTNRTSLTVTGNGAGSTDYCYDNADRLNSTSSINPGQIVYDAHGNMTTQGGETFGYDSSDRLILDDAPGYVDLYQRDPLGRVAQTTNITKTDAGNTATATTGSGSTISLNRPAGTNAGDELVAAVTSSAQNGMTAPTGWTIVTSTQNGGGTTWVLDYQATAGDPTSWTFNVNNSTANIVGSVTDYQNVAGTPIDVSAVADDASSTSQPLPQVTTSGYAETLMHVVGYNGNTTPTAPTSDTSRSATSSSLTSLLVSDTYQDQPGQSAAATATSSSAQASEAITVALTPATAADRLGYSGETDNSSFTQNTAGTTIGVTVGLPGGTTYSSTPTGAVWAYTNNHGDTIQTDNSSNTRTWTGYWGPYGEDASGGSPPSDTAIVGGSLAYNGAQGKLTLGNITLMGARPYESAYGRFTQPDPIQGGCANLYTYGYGDPLNNPDLSGQVDEQAAGGGFACAPKKHHSSFWSEVGTYASVAALAVGAVALLPVDVPGAAIGAIALAGVGTAFDIAGCVNHNSVNCFDIGLAVAGGVGGFGSLGGTLAKLGSLRAGVAVIGSTLGIEGAAGDVASAFAQPQAKPCGG